MAAFMRSRLCSQCMNFACLLNSVEPSVQALFFARNPGRPRHGKLAFPIPIDKEELTVVEKTKDVQSPRGLARLAWRAPIWLYRLGLGGLLGERFVLLNHVGRKSGQPRQAVVEVVYHDKETGAYIVASGFGEKADWYKNVMAHPEVTIQVGSKHMAARARRLPLPQATDIMLDYTRRHPAALRTLAGILGYRTDGSEADVRFLASVIPLLALTPLNLTK